MMRKIKGIARVLTHTSSGWIKFDKPMRIVRLEGCIHEAVSDEPVGAEIECKDCGDPTSHYDRIREFVASDEYSHVTLRSVAANRDPSWSSYMFYRVDRTSPTQCVLAFSAPACDEIEAFIRKCGKQAVDGPSRGDIATGNVRAY